jgi:hypothetical protein
MLCKPGDFIVIEDDLKTHVSNYGRIIEINRDEGWLRLNNQYNAVDYDPYITVFVPTAGLSEDITARQLYANDTTIPVGSVSQIREMFISSFANNSDYGSFVYIDKNQGDGQFFDFIPVGSSYRFRRREEGDSLYQIVSIKEIEKNQFEIIGSLYKKDREYTVDGGETCDPQVPPPPSPPPSPPPPGVEPPGPGPAPNPPPGPGGGCCTPSQVALVDGLDLGQGNQASWILYRGVNQFGYVGRCTDFGYSTNPVVPPDDPLYIPGPEWYISYDYGIINPETGEPEDGWIVSFVISGAGAGFGVLLNGNPCNPRGYYEPAGGYDATVT